MGKKSRRANRRQRKNNSPSQPNHRSRGTEDFLHFSDEVENFARALLNVQTAQWAYEESAHDVDLPMPLREILSVDIQTLLGPLEEMEWAYSYIEADGPTPAKTARGANWTAPIIPGILSHLAEIAGDSDLPFREQANQNGLKDREITERKNLEATAHCPRGAECKVRRVTWPGRDLGPACWRHVTDDEKTELSLIYDSAVTELECRGCHASPGKQCTEDTPRMTRIDGYYSPIRSFNKRKVHRVRLSDYAETLAGQR
ncbi:hypothetical protein [Brevibacterium aurantiacum]|uniref:Uncharacterized protein n=1 Tax=Brevibacterium aurantiacum TaxID=273384 RepID=A0A556C2P1_BREAU|nr:hypothetical protein [Brevibacterium aurantiacum]TSI11724.1 hypothetical protein FO013_21710 [Brevibacterium aurantiacum]